MASFMIKYPQNKIVNLSKGLKAAFSNHQF